MAQVSLPMYAMPPEARAAFWAALRLHLRAAGLDDVPEALSRPDDLEAHWRAPDLLLSQTCGYPLTHVLNGHVRYVGTPSYHVEGCTGPSYRSVIVARLGDAATPLAGFRGATAAFNSADSHSGMNILRFHVSLLAAGPSFFGATLETGSHRASVEAVREGRADIAAIDAVTWTLLGRADLAAVAGLGVAMQTAEAPGLPFITAGTTSDARVAQLRAGLAATFADPDLAATRADLLLDAFHVLDESSYRRVVAFEEQAAFNRYPLLA